MAISYLLDLDAGASAGEIRSVLRISYNNYYAIDCIKFVQHRRTEWLAMAKKAVHKGSDSWPLGQRPGFLIRRLHQIHVALFQKKCAAFDVTPLQYSLLSALARRGTADQTTLAADVALDRTTTTGALKRLQSRKFIERSVHRADRRAQICRLTKAGASLLRRIEASARAAHRETLADLNKAEQKRFIAMMQRIVAAGSSGENEVAAIA
jgi:MarR family transcriptional regulator, lower aerobic nicotinate degradation pathway regulator